MKSANTTLASVFSVFGLLAGSATQAQTTVQLPTLNVTGVSTTVIVPDRGTVSLGGVTSSSLGSRSYGVPFGGHLPGLQQNLGNRSFGRATSVGSFSVSATIIDHAELDRAVLAEAQRRRTNTTRPRSTVSMTNSLPLAGLAGEANRAEVYLQRGRRAEQNGQPQVAKIFYQRVAKHGSAAQQKQAEARLAEIETALRR